MNTTSREPVPTGLIGFLRWIFKVLERVPVALPVLVMRVGVAWVFFRSSLTKLPFGNFATVMLFKEEYMVPILPPEVAAYMATAIELVVPWMLILGIGARFGAGVLLAQILVIQIFVYPHAWPDHLLWAGPLLYLVMRGPGKWSVDAQLRDRIGGGA